MTSIRLHPEYGVNPTCGVCFWCGKDDGTIAMLGAAYKGEAPRRMVLNYDPCDACKDQWAKGIVIIEATHTAPDNRKPLHGGYPTGRFAVLTEDAVRKVFHPQAVVDATLRYRKALVEPEGFDKLMAGYSHE